MSILSLLRLGLASIFIRPFHPFRNLSYLRRAQKAGLFAPSNPMTVQEWRSVLRHKTPGLLLVDLGSLYLRKLFTRENRAAIIAGQPLVFQDLSKTPADLLPSGSLTRLPPLRQMVPTSQPNAQPSPPEGLSTVETPRPQDVPPAPSAIASPRNPVLPSTPPAPPPPPLQPPYATLSGVVWPSELTQARPVADAAGQFIIRGFPASAPTVTLNFHPTLGDGTCFYYAALASSPAVPLRLSPLEPEYRIPLPPPEAHQLRERTVEELQAQASLIRPSLTSDDVPKDHGYGSNPLPSLLANVLTGADADAHAITAVGSLLNRPIVILSDTTGVIKDMGLLETYLDPATRDSDAPTLIAGYEPIFVHHRGEPGGHYSALSVPEGVSARTVFKALYQRTRAIEQYEAHARLEAQFAAAARAAIPTPSPGAAGVTLDPAADASAAPPPIPPATERSMSPRIR
jgi:hypothetical protein